MRFIDKLTALFALGLAACAPSRPPALPQAPSPAPGAAVEVPPAPLGRARNWEEYRLQVAHQLVKANAAASYLTPAPDPLLAIPVLEIELNANGSVRRISVQRTPTQARDTIQLAIDAVKRAEPFADVSHLPRPWKFSQVFLFDDDRRFKPRELD